MISSLLIGYFDSFDSFAVRLILLSLVLFLVLVEVVAIILVEMSINSYLVIERDLQLVGITIFDVNEWIRNKNLHEIIASNNSTDEERWRSQFEILITEFKIRNKILQPLTNYECNKSFPQMP